jgi:ATP-dependent DNA helicase RecQ
MIEPVKSLLQRCVTVDLEVDPSTATVFAFASVRDDARPPILAKKRDLVAALDRLEDENGAYSPLRALA